MVIEIMSQRGHSSPCLLEASRRDLVTKSRQGSKKRFKKRLNYQVSNFRGVDLKKLFESDYFVFQTPINDYVCTIAFPGVLTQLREVMKVTNGDARKVNLQLVIKALRRAFDATDDVKVRCTCADFKYRFMYWADKNGYLYGPPDRGTEEFPEITNPDDQLGATCKHLNVLLSNKRWLVKAASVVNALIKTYPDKAATYLYDPEDIKETEGDEEEIQEIVPEEEVPEEDEVDMPEEDQSRVKVDDSETPSEDEED